MITVITILGSSSLLVFLIWSWERFRYDYRRMARDSNHPSPEGSGSLLPEWAQHHDWLRTHNIYYRALNLDNQARFLRRVMDFMRYKEFKYIDLDPDPMIPLLISSAAVQLTFGLNDFRLDFFDKIYVSGSAYRVHWHKQAFQGHVSLQGIYLSWDHFFHGYQEYDDGHNVGLHEMAHALTYGALMGKTTMEKSFRIKFKDYVKAAHPIYTNMRNGAESVLDRYAATNFHEFWAVSVEAFFEKPLLLKTCEPNLYSSMCELLNQNPLELMVVKAV